MSQTHPDPVDDEDETWNADLEASYEAWEYNLPSLSTFVEEIIEGSGPFFPRAQFGIMDPATAILLLDRNENNRHFNEVTIRKLVADFKAERWELNGETIVINSDGELIDGQNRLTAIRRAQCSAPMLMAMGIPGGARHTLGQGGKRTVAGQLKIRGVKSAGTLASALVVVSNYMTKGLLTRSNTDISTMEIFDLVDKYPVVLQCVAEVKKHRISMAEMAPHGILAGLFALFLGVDHDKARDFFHGMLSGEGLAAGDPRLTIRNTLIKRDKYQNDSERCIEAICRGWTYYLAEAPLTVIKFTRNIPDIKKPARVRSGSSVEEGEERGEDDA